MSKLKFLEVLTNEFEKLPSVGKKTAQRYAYHVVEKLTLEETEHFAKIMLETKHNIKYCKTCGILTDKEICEICESELRDQKTIMVVKDSKDAFAIEKTGQYNGVYHILNGLISPVEGIGPDELNVDNLIKRIDTKEIKEIIIATSFTPKGETTALYLENILKQKEVIISRIGYGLPAGGDIEYVDELTLKSAIESRKNK